MERLRLKKLLEWKNSSARKPLIIRGARQTGKTWLMLEFGRRFYKSVAYINLEKSSRLKGFFEGGYDTNRIITAFELELNLKINAEDTLIIIDEIQEIPRAITSLKYFCEDAPQYHIVAAGSLLGVALHSDVSFPVGKVDFMDLYPLNFTEFLYACGDGKYVELLQQNDWQMVTAFKQTLIMRLKEYYYTGGMPEAVKAFIEGKGFTEVREIQKNILSAYELDFSKHAPINAVPRIRMIWNSILAQLAKENKKFIYGLLKEGSRAKEYEMAISWLTDCGQVYKINRVKKPGLPLKAYEDPAAFKLFIVDVGLLAALGDLNSKTLLESTSIFTEFKGSLTEQYVLQQLISDDEFVIKYWSSENSSAEVDFVIQHKNTVIPIEVKAEENLHAKSLGVYSQKFKPVISIRTSMSDFREQDWMKNIPLYGLGELGRML
jgi:hypothetical protein